MPEKKTVFLIRPSLIALRALPAGVLVLACLGSAAAALHPLLAALWLLCNLGLGFSALLKGLFRPRRVTAGAPSALRWAFGLTLLAVLALASGLETVLAQWGPYLPWLPALDLAAGLPVLVIFCPVLFFLFFLAGLGGAALAVLADDAGPVAQVARHGVASWWLGLLAAAGLSWLLDLAGRAAPAGAAPFSGLPALALGVYFLLRPVGADDRPRRVLRWLARWLVWGRPGRTVDARGAAFGLAAGGLALLLSAAGVLAPFQASVLVSLIQVCNSAVWADARNAAAQPAREQMVLLQMDAAARRKALTTGSEASVQAEVIRRVAARGASRIVLPMPLFWPRAGEQPLEMDFPRFAGTPEAPAPRPEDGARSLGDLPELEAAMRAAGNVLLVVPAGSLPGSVSGRPTDAAPGFHSFGAAKDPVWAAFYRLKEAAAGVGQADLTSFRSVRLPAIATSWTGWYLPAPVLLLAEARGRKPAAGPVPGRPDESLVAGERFPLIAPGLILVDFLSPEVGQPFRRLPYGAVLAGDAVYVPGTDHRPDAPERGSWVGQETFFRGKTVFLDGLPPRQRVTPFGVMPQMEVAAHGAATLLSRQTVRRVRALPGALWVLLAGLLVGHFCLGRDPLEAGWRLALGVFPVLAVSVMSFLLEQLWIDPVAPLLAGVAALGLTGQLTFRMEREEQERHRSLLRRFVAPQVVEHLLRDVDSLGLGGTRQAICVLFADVRGFTQFAEQHAPEEVIEAVNAYMTAMTEALFRYEGLLDKYTGDGLMALFRANGTDHDEIARSVRAALAMQEAAAAVTVRRVAEGKQPLGIGMGLHYGDAVVGLVGNPEQFNYTALGYPVVISSRLQTLAAGSEVVISETVYLALSGSFPVEEREPVYVKGLSRPLRSYRVLPHAPPPAATPEQVGTPRVSRHAPASLLPSTPDP